MTWVKMMPPVEHAAVREVLQKLAALYPQEYDPSRRHERLLPDLVKNDNIMMSHSLIPQAMCIMPSRPSAHCWTPPCR